MSSGPPIGGYVIKCVASFVLNILQLLQESNRSSEQKIEIIIPFYIFLFLTIIK